MNPNNNYQLNLQSQQLNLQAHPQYTNFTIKPVPLSNNLVSGHNSSQTSNTTPNNNSNNNETVNTPNSSNLNQHNFQVINDDIDGN